MNWFKVVLMVLNLLRGLKDSTNEEQFTNSAAAARISANGDLLKWLWANRQQIIDFFKVIFDTLPSTATASVMSIEDWDNLSEEERANLSDEERAARANDYHGAQSEVLSTASRNSELQELEEAFNALRP